MKSVSAGGARSIVMSMWSVPDKETKEIMQEFCEIRLSGYSKLLSDMGGRTRDRRNDPRQITIISCCGIGGYNYWRRGGNRILFPLLSCNKLTHSVTEL